MEVFLMVRRKNTTIFVDAKEESTVEEVKMIITDITKVTAENQQLYKDGVVMDPTKKLQDYDLTSSNALAHDPAILGLTFRDDSTGEFEALEIEPYTSPVDFPEVPDNLDVRSLVSFIVQGIDF